MIAPPFPIIPPQELFGTTNLILDSGSPSAPSSTKNYPKEIRDLFSNNFLWVSENALSYFAYLIQQFRQNKINRP